MVPRKSPGTSESTRVPVYSCSSALLAAPRMANPQEALFSGFCSPQAAASTTHDTTDSRRQAADLLDELYDFLTSIHNHRFLIEVLALQALLQDARGEESVALEKAAKALALAEPGGFIRSFVDST